MSRRLRELAAAGGVSLTTFFLLGLCLPTTDAGVFAESNPQLAPAPLLPAYHPAQPVPAIVIRRDPFAIDPAVVAPRLEPEAAPTATAARLPVLPPNAGATGLPAADDLAHDEPRLIGVAVGDRAYALVDAAAGTRMVTIGDSVGGRTIDRITLGGVTFGDGTHLAVELKP
ncbi:MAG: hypothetical protein ACREM8_06815 [Vulcanimicrobiaceae bacterium]